MFNEKARQIESLEQQVADCELQHGPWIAFAKELADRVHESEQTTTLSFEENVISVIGTLAEEKRRQRLLDTFEALDPERRWAILSGLFGDDSLRAMLDESHKALENLTERQKAVSIMSQESRAIGRFDVARVPEGAEMLLDLRDPDNMPTLERLRTKRLAKPDRLIRAIALGGGLFHVIGDTIPEWEDDEDKSPKPDLSDHEITQFGTAQTNKEVITTLYRNAKVRCMKNGKLKELYVDDYYEEYEVRPLLHDITVDGISMLTDTSDFES